MDKIKIGCFLATTKFFEIRKGDFELSQQMLATKCEKYNNFVNTCRSSDFFGYAASFNFSCRQMHFQSYMFFVVFMGHQWVKHNTCKTVH